MKNALDKFIRTGEIDEITANTPFLKNISKIKETCRYSNTSEYIYENIYGFKSKLIFKRYYEHLLYAKREDGKYLRAFRPVIENLACEISERIRECFLEEFRGLRYLNIAAMKIDYYRLIEILDSSNGSFFGNYEEKNNKITTKYYFVDRYFENEEEMEKDCKNPEMPDVSFMISLVIDDEF